MADEALTRLHPDHVKEVRVSLALAMLPLLVLALVGDAVGPLPPGLFFAPIVLAAIVVVLFVPRRRYFARGYAMGADRLRVVRGILFRSDTVVPFGRVQHLDVERGPVERYYGLATLVLHTAGTSNSSVSLPGLLHEDALAMREEIRAHVRRETL
jgi:membrane protein YdbS with pleckstrin-like domain